MENSYESNKLLSEYLLFHYGDDDEVMPWSDGPQNGLRFPVRTVQELVDSNSLKSSNNSRALDVGCSVGRSAFELTAYCKEVQGCDLSQSFIDAAKSLAERSELPYKYLEEGDSYKSTKAKVTSSSITSPTFFVADACSLPSNLGDFDIVHAANLICRLPDPSLFLNQLPNLVKSGGQLILATPFTWLEEYTPRDKWIGSGDSESKLAQCLSPFFKLEQKVELPFVIREHRRKFQYSVSLGTRWRRTDDF
ncbi:MAG: putative 4-mercaptohistidine N1-methyltransferase [Opitutae bacterium]|jgi:putative 4-mercaptohistidine N1-methyltranferase|nr:putative 4-mercaptohistidine N1-methyltransferase [Opitutae bacterium]